MQYRKLGQTEIDVSVIALGTMTWGEQNSEAEAHAQLDFAVERGVNLIDTAEMYPVPPKPETQGLTENDLLAFASYFGGIFRPPTDVPVSNAVGEGDYTGHGELTPHSDHHWTPQPSSGSLLYAIELPKDGGATSWYNTVQAYADLDQATKDEINGLQLITYNPFLRIKDKTQIPKYRFSDQPILGAAFPHPLVRTHAESGKQGLYLDYSTEVEVVGYDDQKGSALIERLRAHIVQPKYRYEHQWEVGDIVYWDNQVTLHSRQSFPAEQRRLLKRVSLAGGRPF